MSYEHSSINLFMLQNNPWTRHLSKSAVLNIATLGPVGHMKAPGTMASIVGMIFYFFIMKDMHELPYFMIVGFMVYFGISICAEAEFRLKKKDPSQVVLDEFVAIPFCFLDLDEYMHTYSPFLIIILAFILFRFFDIKKPLFINKIQALRGGFGMVLDDIAAALVTNVILNIIFWGLSIMRV